MVDWLTVTDSRCHYQNKCNGSLESSCSQPMILRLNCWTSCHWWVHLNVAARIHDFHVCHCKLLWLSETFQPEYFIDEQNTVKTKMMLSRQHCGLYSNYTVVSVNQCSEVLCCLIGLRSSAVNTGKVKSRETHWFMLCEIHWYDLCMCRVMQTLCPQTMLCCAMNARNLSPVSVCTSRILFAVQLGVY